MFRVLPVRQQQGHRTLKYPETLPELPDRLRARPAIDQSRCVGPQCRACRDCCPTEAISFEGALKLDLGRCLFCAACQEACPEKALEFTNDHRLAVSTIEQLQTDGTELRLAKRLDREAHRLFGRSLQLRQVSAGGCNGCEVDVNVLTTVVFDLSRFGIKIVASPRHADGLLVTGCVTENMRLALQKTYEAVPAPKLVIAVGACAISGGPFRDHPEQHNGAATFLPVDLFVPGCPPHPLTILDGLLRLLGKMES